MSEAGILHVEKFVPDADLDFILGVREDAVAVANDVKLKIINLEPLELIF